MATPLGILESVKDSLGIPLNDSSSDSEVVRFINTAFMFLHQLGVGPTQTYVFDGSPNTPWTEFHDDVAHIQGVKTYVYLQTKLLYDPSPSSVVMDSIRNSIRELTDRLMLEANDE